jgi:signal transduction histidine kinase
MNMQTVKTFGITKRTIIIGIAILVIVAVGIYAALNILDRWTQEIVTTNTRLTKESVHKISDASKQIIDSLSKIKFFDRKTLSRSELRQLDSLFSRVTANQVIPIRGMEGGFYLTNIDELIGYSWPTSPDPKPAYGPAPRSFPTIKVQLLETVKKKMPLVEFHSFDFAIYPLSTEPIWADGNIVGAVWARIHVEKELPKNQLTKILNIAVIVALGAFGAALILLWIRKLHIDAIRAGLEQLSLNPSFRLPESSGVYGIINRSINRMVDAWMEEQKKREQLERELHQKDKMATLGKLIAGVAHEVKTPLAIIKTRVQMWQRDMIELNAAVATDTIITKDAMQLVVREIDRLSKLVKRLLVFSKPVTTKLQKQDVNMLLAQTLAFVQTGIEEKKITVITEYDRAIPTLHLDPQGIEQVFLNILMNAIDAMNEGDILTLITRYDPKKQQVEITAYDTGEGIPSDVAPKIFDPFFTTKEQGVGLGLSISHEIVKAHGGIIEFLHPGNRGTICKISLPCT